MNGKMNHGILACLILVLAGCGGTGPQGPAGPAGPPADRSKLYCRINAAVLNLANSNDTATIACDVKTDMPWQGTCDAPDMPSGVFLARNEPVGWDNTNVIPGWTCTWAAFQAAPNLNFSANAEICCYAIGR